MEAKGKGKKVLLILLAVFLVYGAGLVFFSLRTYPRTTVNGKKMAFQSTADFYQKPVSENRYRFVGREGDQLEVTAQDLRASFPLKGEAPRQASAFAWPVEVFKRHDYQVDYENIHDDARLDYLIREGGFSADGRPAQDAKIVSEDGNFVIQKEDPGKKADLPALKELVLASLGLEQTQIDVDAIYDSPKVLAEDANLQKKLAQVQAMVKTKISIQVGEKSYPFNGDALLSALDEGEDAYTLNDQKLRDWVKKIAQETDTYGTSRQFETTGAGQVEVPPGIYGWRMDVDETLKELKEKLASNTSAELEPVYKVHGMARGEMNDIGSTYIEIDLSRQHLWAYKEGELLMDSPVKTGMHNGENETPRGVHMIWSREKGKTLKGIDMTGDRYESPVKYWMPVNYGGVGLHDADWVHAFGGTEYLYRGSNGCINLPLETAKTIYENYTNGTPVVVYESTTDYSPADHTF